MASTAVAVQAPAGAGQRLRRTGATPGAVPVIRSPVRGAKPTQRGQGARQSGSLQRAQAAQAPAQVDTSNAIGDESAVYDVVVVGAGISGLTTALVRRPPAACRLACCLPTAAAATLAAVCCCCQKMHRNMRTTG